MARALRAMGFCVLMACGGGSKGTIDAPSGPTIDGPNGTPDSAVPDNLSITKQITMPAKPLTMDIDRATNRLYVAIASDPSNFGTGGAGITVLDTTNDSIVTTIPNPVGPPPFNNAAPTLGALAVDATANKIYATNTLLDARIYVYDGSNNNALTPIDVTGTATNSGIKALAVDEAGHRLYAAVNDVNFNAAVAVIDTSTGSQVTLVSTTDMVGPRGLALDTQNHLVFVCGATPFNVVPSGKAAADAIDTTTNTVTGTQQVFEASAGDERGCGGLPGFAAMVNDVPTSKQTDPAELEALEPVKVPLPDGFRPTGYGEEKGTRGRIRMTIYGRAPNPVQGGAISPAHLDVTLCGEGVQDLRRSFDQEEFIPPGYTLTNEMDSADGKYFLLVPDPDEALSDGGAIPLTDLLVKGILALDITAPCP